MAKRKKDPKVYESWYTQEDCELLRDEVGPHFAQLVGAKYKHDEIYHFRGTIKKNAYALEVIVPTSSDTDQSYLFFGSWGKGRDKRYRLGFALLPDCQYSKSIDAGLKNVDMDEEFSAIWKNYVIAYEKNITARDYLSQKKEKNHVS